MEKDPLQPSPENGITPHNGGAASAPERTPDNAQRAAHAVGPVATEAANMEVEDEPSAFSLGPDTETGTQLVPAATTRENRNEPENSPEVIRDRYQLADPLLALRFRRAIEARHKEDQGTLMADTRRHFWAWGIGPAGPDAHAFATLIGLSDEQWEKQMRSVDPAADGVEFVSERSIQKFNELIRDRNLEARVAAVHGVMKPEDIEPMRVSTLDDKRKAMSVNELDDEIRRVDDVQEKVRIISTYLLPRIDEQEQRIHSGALSEDEKKQAVLNVADIEDRLEQLGIHRIATANEAFNDRLHQAVLVSGDGSRWMIEQEIRAGYVLGKRALRPAQVKVLRVNPEDMSEEQLQGSRQKRREGKADRHERPERAHGQSSKKPALNKQEQYEQDKARYDRTVERVENLKNHPVLGVLVNDEEALRQLHRDIHEDIPQKYQDRLAEINAAIDKENESRADDDQKPRLASTVELPKTEKEKILFPIAEEMTKKYISSRLSKDQLGQVNDEVRRTILHAEWLATDNLTKPEEPPKPQTKPKPKSRKDK